MEGIVYSKNKNHMLRLLIKALLMAPLLMAILLTTSAQQSPQIKGRVLDEQGDPVEGVSVLARQGTKEAGSTLTDKDGAFAFGKLDLLPDLGFPARPRIKDPLHQFLRPFVQQSSRITAGIA